MRASSFAQRGEDLGECVDFGSVAGFGGALPLGDVVELVDLFEAVEERVAAEGVELVLAEVVGAAFHVADFEGAEDGFEEGDVLEVELLLEVFGAGGDDDALLVLAGEAEGGEEVGEGFAGAGAGFDDEVTLVLEGLFDGSGHVVLAGAVLEGERGAGEESAGGEEVVERGDFARGVGVGGGDLDGGGHARACPMIVGWEGWGWWDPPPSPLKCAKSSKEMG